MSKIPPHVKSGAPVRASHHNQIVDALRKLNTLHAKVGPFQRSRVAAEDSHPFKISVGEKDGAKIVSVKGGIWLGDGVSARGILGVSAGTGSEDEIKRIPYQPGQDAWKIDDTEFPFSFSGNRHFFIKNKMKNGRVFGEWKQVAVEVGTEGASETEMQWFNVMEIDHCGDGSEYDRMREGKNPAQFLIGSVDLEAGEIVQIRRDNIYYAPNPDVAAPLVFFPTQDGENEFECLGGLLRVNPNRIDGGGEFASVLNPEGSETSETATIGTLIPRATKLRPFITAIPPHTFTIPESGAGTEAVRVNGWLVVLRVSMDYIFTIGDSELYPNPSIAWDVLPIPNGGATACTPWDCKASEIAEADAPSASENVRAFLSAGEDGMPFVAKFSPEYASENGVSWRFNFALGIEQSPFESIIPVGVLHRPFVSNNSEFSPASEIKERFVYVPIQKGIIDWTPPLHGRFETNSADTEA